MILFTSIVGSQLHGFATEKSDTDRVSVVVHDLRDVLSVHGSDNPKSKQEHGENDHATYELRHFCRLLLKGNPTVYEALNSNLMEVHEYEGDVLADNMNKFLDSRAIYSASRGYAQASRVKSEKKQIEAEDRGKAVLAGVRILMEGFDLLMDGVFDPQPAIDLDLAQAMRSGDEAAIADGVFLLAHHEENLDRLYDQIRAGERPEWKPNVDWINGFIYDTYTSQVPGKIW